MILEQLGAVKEFAIKTLMVERKPKFKRYMTLNTKQ